MISTIALIVAIFALAHSIRMKNWIARVEASQAPETPETIWRKAGAI